MIMQLVLIGMSYISRIKQIRDGQLEVPGTFLNELHRWSLECKYNLSQHFHFTNLNKCCVFNSIGQNRSRYTNGLSGQNTATRYAKAN